MYCCTPKALYNHVWDPSSTTTSVQHPLGWCDSCHRTTAPVRSPHTSYRWRGEREIEPIKWMGIIRRPWLTRASGGNFARTPGLHPGLVFSCCLVVWSLTFCLVYWITPLVKPSGYCSPIEDHAHLLEYSFALPSMYLFCHLFDPAYVLTMPINTSLHMDPHASCLVGPVTITASRTCNKSWLIFFIMDAITRTRQNC